MSRWMFRRNPAQHACLWVRNPKEAETSSGASWLASVFGQLCQRKNIHFLLVGLFHTAPFFLVSRRCSLFQLCVLCHPGFYSCVAKKLQTLDPVFPTLTILYSKYKFFFAAINTPYCWWICITPSRRHSSGLFSKKKPSTRQKNTCNDLLCSAYYPSEGHYEAFLFVVLLCYMSRPIAHLEGITSCRSFVVGGYVCSRGTVSFKCQWWWIGVAVLLVSVLICVQLAWTSS